MSKQKIIRIPIMPFGMVNAHLVVGDAGCILVDAGVPGSEVKVEKTLKDHGLSFGDIKLIVVTHAHGDHAGAALAIREKSQAPIVAHINEVKHLNREEPMSYCTTGLFGKLFLKTPIPHVHYDAVIPDIVLNKHDKLDLNDYGVAGVVGHTPGHTEGSISVDLDSNDALVGDLVASGILLGGLMRTHRAIRPPFEDDPHTTGLTLMKMVDSGVQRFHLGHGGPLPSAEVSRHARFLLNHQ